MPTPFWFCPHCACGLERLEEASNDADVNYLRCTGCGHVWIFPKAGDRGTPRDIPINSSDQKTSSATTINFIELPGEAGIHLTGTADPGAVPFDVSKLGS